MRIEDLTKGFVDIAEWQHFCSAQNNTIINLTKEINELKDRNKHLEKLLGDTTPLVGSSSSIQNIKDLTDEEAIAVMELAKLREISLDRELTGDECKKYDTYTKNLLIIRNNKKKNPQDPTEQLTDEQLLSIVKEK